MSLSWKVAQSLLLVFISSILGAQNSVKNQRLSPSSTLATTMGRAWYWPVLPHSLTIIAVSNRVSRSVMRSLGW